MKRLTIIFFLFWSFTTSYSQDSVKIFGHVTDFDNQPIDSVSVRLKNANFENLYETMTGKDGFFSLTVSKGSYYCLYAIKLADYGKTKLEYWAWNVPAYNDLEINPQYDKMEIYAVNVFEPQVKPGNTYMVYFRPMSLSKSLIIQGNKTKKEMEQKLLVKHDTLDIAPSSIDKEELDISINGRTSEIISITKIPEYARGGYLYGYIVQVKKPEEVNINTNEYDKITIILESKATGDRGKGECFVRRVE